MASRQLSSKKNHGAAHILQVASNYLTHPEIMSITSEASVPLADDLYKIHLHLNRQGPLKKSDVRQIMDIAQRAADILQSPQASAIPFAIRSSNVARGLRELIADLKKLLR